MQSSVFKDAIYLSPVTQGLSFTVHEHPLPSSNPYSLSSLSTLEHRLESTIDQKWTTDRASQIWWNLVPPSSAKWEIKMIYPPASLW